VKVRRSENYDEHTFHVFDSELESKRHGVTLLHILSEVEMNDDSGDGAGEEG